ncbi:hemocytin [Eurytemora carolleeae]|uniref:hemocytin n=1 Tax=Eurytemora carolleeae TaxID=1294199 RepID=UPI000C78DF4F|nr:hemocytin [Eurytemora carolleeae]|eukprot:XP_023329164.1 hemocytin-like [Eurytemora affinis]
MMDENYVTESILNPDQCCPLVKRTACKVNGNIYQVGTTWVGTDICSEYSCELVEGEAIIKVKEKLCDRSCGKGFEYEPTPGSCCGRCIQTHCKLDSGDLILPGSTVQLDNCTKLNCILLDTKVTLREVSAVCPPLPPDCPPSHIYLDDAGCCSICSSNQVCSLKPSSESRGEIAFYDPEHGNCSNPEPVPGWSECGGACSSGSRFNSRLGDHISYCTCCQTTAIKSLSVNTLCQDGYTLTVEITIPSECSCQACVESKGEDQIHSNTAYSSSSLGNINTADAVNFKEKDGKRNEIQGFVQEQEPLPNQNQGYIQEQEPLPNQNQGYIQEQEPLPNQNQGYIQEQEPLPNQN